MKKELVIRAFDGARWLIKWVFTSEVDDPGLEGHAEMVKLAESRARDLQELTEHNPNGPDQPAFLLIEIAEVDAHAAILRQWVRTDTGYKRVIGR